MESIFGLSNWKLTVRRETDHIVILRAVTCDVRASLPDYIFGLPVTVLDDHALASGSRTVSGEEVRIVCGHEGEWDNRNIQDLKLPEFLTDIRNYAFYGCRSLHTLRLHDRADSWGGGCLMNCRSLNNIHLTRVGEEHGKALPFLCGELHDELDVSIHECDGTLTRLIFPDYAETYEENFANHHFDYFLSGGGFAYHHIFREKQLNLRSYDELWGKYLREGHDRDTAIRLAYYRLRWPTELSDFAEKQYSSYLAENAADALLWQLSLKDTQGLSLLLDRLQPDSFALQSACEQARRERYTEGLALLLERQQKQKPTGFDRDFDL